MPVVQAVLGTLPVPLAIVALVDLVVRPGYHIPSLLALVDPSAQIEQVDSVGQTACIVRSLEAVVVA